jgi:predicted kinase
MRARVLEELQGVGLDEGGSSIEWAEECLRRAECLDLNTTQLDKKVLLSVTQKLIVQRFTNNLKWKDIQDEIATVRDRDIIHRRNKKIGLKSRAKLLFAATYPFPHGFQFERVIDFLFECLGAPEALRERTADLLREHGIFSELAKIVPQPPWEVIRHFRFFEPPTFATLADAPGAPDWEVRVDRLALVDWVRRMQSHPQNKTLHAEGDVWRHTEMVVEKLAASNAYRALSRDDQVIVYLACLIHDVAKPWTTRTASDGTISPDGHSEAGALFARRILWELVAPFDLREQVCGLIRFHHVPSEPIADLDAQRRRLAELSFSCRADLLAIVAESNVRGRVSDKQDHQLENIRRFQNFCEDEGCLKSKRPFVSDHARVLYFRADKEHLDDSVSNNTCGELIMTCGLPGSGMHNYIRKQSSKLPVVSLDVASEIVESVRHLHDDFLKEVAKSSEILSDETRALMESNGTEKHRAVVQQARERLSEHLRNGQRVVYHATNINRRLREPLLSLAHQHGARITIVYFRRPGEGVAHTNSNSKSERLTNGNPHVK